MTHRALRLPADPTGSLDGVVDALVAGRAQIAALHAQEAALLAEALHIGHAQVESLRGGKTASSELPYRAIAAEIGAAIRVPDRTIQRLMDEAAALVESFHLTYDALAAGRISLSHAHEILAAGSHIDDAALIALYESCILPFAEVETAGRMKDIAPRIADQVLPRSTNEKHQAARATRAVRVVDLPDGMAELIATLPGVLAHGVLDRLTQIARAVRDDPAPEPDADGGGEALFDLPEGGAPDAAGPDSVDGLRKSPDVETDAPRTLDQLRADVLTDLLLTAGPGAHDAGSTDLGAIRAHVQVTVPVLTLIDPDHTVDPAELDGVGPIDAHTARILAGGATAWTRILVHPVTGTVLATDRYRPPEALSRALRIRDGRCRFVGCRMPARRCDIDHSIDHARGGATCRDNLACLCERHHVMKHGTAWKVEHRAGGVLAWTSPTGRRYIDTPLSTVRFAPAEADLPPF